jgi:hypothetical protein
VLPGRKYEVISTGEIFDMAPKGGSKLSGGALRKTFSDLRALIRTNFTAGGQNQIMLTLTYARHETNIITAQEDFEYFWRRLKTRKAFKGHKLEYISVLEPQASGRWHFHVMIKSDQPELWVDKWEIKRIWGRERGNAHIERLKSDDVGAYYVAYFTHLMQEESPKHAENFNSEMAQLEDENIIHDPDAGEKRMKMLTKTQIKGERLKYYPKDAKLFRCSRGIKRPETSETVYEDANERNLGKRSYVTTREVLDEDGKQINIIQKEYFNKNRKPSNAGKKVPK